MKKNKKAYTEKMGQAAVISGAGLLAAGVIDFVAQTWLGWILFALAFVIALGMMIVAQRNYSDSLF